MNFLGSSKIFDGPGIDVKDPRFLGTIAAIPLLHVIVMWTRPRYRLGPLDYVVVALQAAIFAFALQIRSPVVWAVLALSAFWLTVGALALRRGRSLRSLCDWRQSRSALMPIAVLAVLFSAQLLAAATLHPLYRAQGDVPRHMFWQGLLTSLQLNPEWGAKYLASVDNYTGDMMPEEMARLAIMKLPPEERQQYLRGDGWPRRTALEKFTRLAFFDFLRNDPKFVAHTFFIDKPEWAWRSEQQFFGGLFSGLPIWNALIPAAAVLFLVVLVACNADAPATLLPTAGVIPSFYRRLIAAELVGVPEPDGHDRQFRLDRRFSGAVVRDCGGLCYPICRRRQAGIGDGVPPKMSRCMRRHCKSVAGSSASGRAIEVRLTTALPLSLPDPSQNDRRNFGKDEGRLPAPNQPRLGRAMFKRSFDLEWFRKHQIDRAGRGDIERRHRDFFGAR